MYKDVLRSIEGAELMPSIALIIFLTFFIGMLIWVYRRDTQTIDEISRLPLDDGDKDQLVNGHSKE